MVLLVVGSFRGDAVREWKREKEKEKECEGGVYYNRIYIYIYIKKKKEKIQRAITQRKVVSTSSWILGPGHRRGFQCCTYLISPTLVI